MKTVYLCGPINKCTDGEANDWRTLAKLSLSNRYRTLDPMRRDYRGRELEPGIADEIVAGDKKDLWDSDILLAYCPKPSVGTSMEIFMMYGLLGKTVIIVHPDDNPSPWLIAHSHKVFTTFSEAFLYLQTL